MICVSLCVCVSGLHPGQVTRAWAARDSWKITNEYTGRTCKLHTGLLAPGVNCIQDLAVRCDNSTIVPPEYINCNSIFAVPIWLLKFPLKQMYPIYQQLHQSSPFPNTMPPLIATNRLKHLHHNSKAVSFGVPVYRTTHLVFLRISSTSCLM